MTILLVGKTGQVARSLIQRFEQVGRDYRVLGRNELDLSRTDRILPTLHQQGTISCVVNAAAYTAVDLAESQPELSDQINHLAPAKLATYCDAMDIPLIHFSTDYVFDGESQKANVETDNPNPLNCYGQSKLDGERAIQAICQKHVILRTSGVFSQYGGNFVKTMLRLGNERQQLRIVSDQVTCPTSAEDIALVLDQLLDSLHNQWGVYHLCSGPAVSWYDFASAVFQYAGMEVELTPIPSSGYPTPARRPLHSVLCTDKLTEVFNIPIPSWQIGLERVVKLLVENEGA